LQDKAGQVELMFMLLVAIHQEVAVELEVSVNLLLQVQLAELVVQDLVFIYQLADQLFITAEGEGAVHLAVELQQDREVLAEAVQDLILVMALTEQLTQAEAEAELLMLVVVVQQQAEQEAQA